MGRTKCGSFILLCGIGVLLGEFAKGSAPSRSLEVLHAFTAAGGESMGNLVRAADGTLYGTSRADGISLGTVFALTPDGMGGFTHRTLHAFNGAEGIYPEAGLTLASDGFLYGTTTAVSGILAGSVFRILPDGNGYAVVHLLTAPEGSEPSAPLLDGGDGFLYGSCRFGGDTNHGTLFRIDAAGQFTRIYSFSGPDGSEPFGRLYRDSGGNIWGTTAQGGSSFQGTIFEIPAGGSLNTVYSFSGADGAWPTGGLTLAGDGKLYGSTRFGGPTGNGEVYRFTPPSTVVPIHTFSGTDGDAPIGDLVLDANGKLLGATYDGGTGNFGTVFRISTDANFETLHEFSESDGEFPWGGVAADPAGNVYAATIAGGLTNTGTVIELDSSQNETVLHTFLAGGSLPLAPLLSASDGLLYGTTSDGYNGTSVLFQVTAAQALNVFGVALGLRPWSLVESTDGWFYGTSFNGLPGNSFGAIFRAKLDGTFDAFHEFTELEGTEPLAGLTRAANGNYYGTTSFQGANGDGSFFELDGNDLTVSALHGFDGISDGPPCGRLLETSPNVFHASSPAGGAFGAGVLMRIDANGARTVIHSFDPDTDQASAPCGDLALGADGFLYGTTSGSVLDGGTIFKASLDGAIQVLHRFSDSDGSPPAGLTLTPEGAAWGTMAYGGAKADGFVFRLDGAGRYDSLYAFDGLTGTNPVATLTLHVDGFLYGTTMQGGYGFGTLFRISTATPGVTLSPTSGPADAAIPITISGSRFDANALIRIGEIGANDVQVVDPTLANATTPVLTPGTLNHVLVLNPDLSSATVIDGWLADFLDVPQGDPFHPAVETLFRNHITAGYGDGNYGRNDAISRAQMSVFVLKGAHGSGFHPPHCVGLFSDAPCPDVFTDWIEELYNENITSGCQSDPLLFCPDRDVTRAESAVFLLRAEHGSNYAPPHCVGLFDDVPCPDGFAVDWIEQFFNEGITSGCGNNDFCPDQPTTRAQMAVFVNATFHLE